MGQIFTIFATLGGLFLWFAILSLPILVYFAYEAAFHYWQVRQRGKAIRPSGLSMNDENFADTRVVNVENVEIEKFQSEPDLYQAGHAFSSIDQLDSDIQKGNQSPFPELPLALVRPIATHAPLHQHQKHHQPPSKSA